jgi:hypothetical protein
MPEQFAKPPAVNPCSASGTVNEVVRFVLDRRAAYDFAWGLQFVSRCFNAGHRLSLKSGARERP